MSAQKHDKQDEPEDIRELARDLLRDFLEDADQGQKRAVVGAAQRTLLGEKAKPFRDFAQAFDDHHGNIFSRGLGRALESLLPRRK